MFSCDPVLRAGIDASVHPSSPFPPFPPSCPSPAAGPQLNLSPLPKTAEQASPPGPLATQPSTRQPRKQGWEANRPAVTQAIVIQPHPTAPAEDAGGAGLGN